MPRREEPTAADLAEIEAEWPLIEAELAVVDAEIRLASAGVSSAFDWRRLRRAEHQVLAAAVRHGEFGDGVITIQHQASVTDYLDNKDWGDGFGDGHHPSLCDSRCPCRSAVAS